MHCPHSQSDLGYVKEGLHEHLWRKQADLVTRMRSQSMLPTPGTSEQAKSNPTGGGKVMAPAHATGRCCMPDASSLLSKARRQQMGSSKASAYELLSADQAMATRQSGMGEAAPGVAADPMECRVGDGPRARRLEGLMAMNVFEEGGGRDAYPAPLSVLHRKKFSGSKSNLTQQPSNWRKGETAEDQKAAAAAG
jgi:hypothetical protein